MVAQEHSTFFNACVSIWLLSACLPAASAHVMDRAAHTCPPQTPCICVLVINSTRVPEDAMSVALHKAGLIFRTAGVRVIWVGQPGGSLQQTAFPGSRSDSVNMLVLRIISRPAGGIGSPYSLGFALVAGEDSKYASVFRDRILAATRSGLHSEGMLMGHAIAHELGHLLLGTAAHSRYGLMAGRWRTSELDRAEVGLLNFSPAEAARLQNEALRRTIHKPVSAENPVSH